MSEALRSRGAELSFAGFRVLLGVLFLSVWASNLHKGLYSPSGYERLIHFYLDGGSAPAPWKSAMRFAADHATVFARLQLVGEVALGVLLLIGLLTRLAGLGAAAFLAALWLSEVGVPTEWVWSLVFPAVLAFLVAVLPESRFLSLDRRLGR